MKLSRHSNMTFYIKYFASFSRLCFEKDLPIKRIFKIKKCYLKNGTFFSIEWNDASANSKICVSTWNCSKAFRLFRFVAVYHLNLDFGTTELCLGRQRSCSPFVMSSSFSVTVHGLHGWWTVASRNFGRLMVVLTFTVWTALRPLLEVVNSK